VEIDTLFKGRNFVYFGLFGISAEGLSSTSGGVYCRSTIAFR
jgi:hypothetical protein